MTILDHVNSAGVGALGAVSAVGAGAVVAVGAGGGVAGGAVVVGIAAATVFMVDDLELKPRAAMAGALCSAAAIVFTTYCFGHEAPQSPALVGADAPVKTLVARAACEGVQVKYPQADSARVEFVLPQGCKLTPAP